MQFGLLGSLLLSLSACGLSTQTASEAPNKPSSPAEAPKGLTYSMKTLTLIKRVSFPNLTPTLAAGEASNFSISPVLPEGLVFEATTGSIGGTPTKAFPVTKYTISANNKKGVVNTSLNIEVLTTSSVDSEVVASPNTLIANLSDESSVTVTLLSKNGYPIKNERVSLRSSRGSEIDQIHALSSTTDSSGVAIFKVRSKFSGSATLFAFDEEDQILVVPVATVEFLAGPLHHYSFSKAAPSVVAGSASEIIIAARDQYDNLCINHSGNVDLFLSDARATTSSSRSGFTNGLAKFQNVIFKTSGVQTALISDGSLELGPRNITVAPASPHHLAFQVEPASIGIANEILSTSPSVGVYDSFDNLVEGSSVAISLTATTDGACSNAITGALLAKQNPLNATDGVSAFQDTRILRTTVKHIKASTPTSGISSACTGEITIASGSPSIADSSIQGTGPVIADGSSLLEVRILLKDGSGNPVPGVTPTFDATDTGGSNLYGDCSVTDETGNSTCTLASTKAESKTLRLLSPIEKSGSLVAFKNGPAASYLVSGFPSSVTAGTTGSVTVSVLDANLNPVLDYQGIVRLSSSDSNAVLPGDFAFNPSDLGLRLISGITLRTSGTRSLTATDTLAPGVTGTQSGIEVAAAAYSAPHSDLGSSRTTLASGETTTLTLNLRDAYGNSNPVTEPQLSDIVFSSSAVGGSGTFGAVHKSGSGTYQVDFTAVKSGAATISAKIGGISVIDSLSIAIDPGTASSLVLSGISSPVQAGTLQSLSVTAKDAAGNTVTGYSETIALSSSDLLAVLEAPKKLTNGTGTFAVTLKTASSQSISATDGTMNADLNGINVTPAAYSLATSEVSTSSNSIVSNQTATVTLTLKDLYGNRSPIGVPDSGYINFTSTMTNGTGTFGSLQNLGSGVYTSVFTGIKAGTVSIAATISNQPLSSKVDVLVTPDQAVSLSLSSLPTTSTAGQSFNFGISALDSNGNLVANYSGTPIVSSSDTSAILPPDSDLNSGSGTRTIILKTSGNQTITVNDGNLTVTSPMIAVTSAQASSLSFLATPTSATAGAPFTYSITARDAFGNLAIGYGGTLNITSSDSKASLPSSPVLSSGSGTFSSTLKTAGTQTLTVSDGTLSANSSSITVNADAYAPSNSTVTASANRVTSGNSITLTLTPKDLYGNLMPSGLPDLSKILFTSSAVGGTGTLGTPVAESNGTYTIEYTGLGAGLVTLSATLDGTPAGTSGNVTVDPGDATSLILSSIPYSSIAGTSFNVIVTALDQNQNTATGFAGAVTFSSSDPAATLPASTNLVSGTKTVSMTLKTAGPQTFTVTAPTFSKESSTILVSPGVYSLAESTISTASQNAVSGATVLVTLSVKDAYGNSNPSGMPALASIAFTSSSGGGGTGTFGAISDLGSSVYQALFTANQAGGVTLGATLSGTPVTNTAPLTVTPGTASRLVLGSIPASTISGSSLTVSVTAKDAAGNTATGYSGSVAITSTDSAATLPNASTLTNGTGSFLVKLNTAGSSTLTASDGTLAVTSTSITVSAGTASSLALSSIPSSANAGSAFTFMVTAKDASGNTATGYNGTVSITSSDSAAALPSSATLLNGVGTFSLTLKTAGSKTLTASGGSLSATSSAITVNPGAYSTSQSVVTLSSSSVTSGSSITATLTAKDAYGNLNPSGLPADSAILFTSSSVGGTGTFSSITNTGSGVYTASFTGVSSGSATLGATLSGAAVSTNASLTVGAGSASRFAITAPSSVTSGNSFSFTVTAQDDAGNTATGFSGTLLFTSSDASATLPASSTLNSGSKTFSAILRTAGSRSITVTSGSLSKSFSISVDASGASLLVLSGVPSSSAAGDAFTFTVTAKDSNGNIATGYSSQITIQSSDSRADLPAAANLVQGSGSFTLTLKTAGTRNLTASDGTLSASSSVSVISGIYSPGQSILSASGASVVSGESITVTLTTKDAQGNLNPTGLPSDSSILFNSSLVGGTGTFGTLTNAGSGVYTATFTGVKSGTTILSSTISGSSVSNTLSISVSPGPLSVAETILSPSNPTFMSGYGFTVWVHPRDANGNQNPTGVSASMFGTSITSQGGSVQSYAAASFGSAYTLSVSGILVGSLTLEFLVDGVGTGRTFDLTVIPGDFAELRLTGVPATIDQGTAFDLGISAVDSNGNLLITNNDTLSISASSGESWSTSLASGQATRSVSFGTSGTQTLTVALGGIQAVSAPVTVNSLPDPSPTPTQNTPGWFVELRGPKTHCSGVLLSDGSNAGVITPADCVDALPSSEIQLVYSDGSTSEVTSITPHSRFDSGTLAYDLAWITPSTSGGTAIDTRSDLVDPRTMSSGVFIGFSNSKELLMVEAKMGGSVSGLKSFDTSTMFTITTVDHQGQGGALTLENKGSASGYQVAGFSFYNSEGIHALINLTSTEIQTWITGMMGGSTLGVTTIAGFGGPGSSDGMGSSEPYAQFSRPGAVLGLDNGHLVFTDTENSTIRYFDRTGDEITTIAGAAGSSGELDGTGAGARFSSPHGIAQDPLTGMIYVSDRDGQTIRGITLSAEKTTVTTVAGQAYSSGFTDAEALSATFSSPKDLAWYDGGLLILDSGNGALRYLKDGAVTTLSDPSWFTAPVSLAVSSDNRIFVVDQGDQTIKVIDGGRVMSIYAGLTTRSGYDEGGSDTATFATPLGIAVDQSGNVFVGDQNGLVIRKIDTGQVVSTYAGTGAHGNADGALLSATFSLISSITSLPTGELMVIDGKASLIRQIRRSK